ncbi:hypothetical protein pdam_00012477 [Pocillopora damicornis]|uniref:Uncharacterized protein n=1 Tax=Pocillopora damicornis TaxID=46731 RepID=A0A3M6TKJ4_POCDA|nr:hypothetical protein pdam_00012477 [Pocillopora damicornis]
MEDSKKICPYPKVQDVSELVHLFMWQPVKFNTCSTSHYGLKSLRILENSSGKRIAPLAWVVQRANNNIYWINLSPEDTTATLKFDLEFCKQCHKNVMGNTAKLCWIVVIFSKTTKF